MVALGTYSGVSLSATEGTVPLVFESPTITAHLEFAFPTCAFIHPLLLPGPVAEYSE